MARLRFRRARDRLSASSASSFRPARRRTLPRSQRVTPATDVVRPGLRSGHCLPRQPLGLLQLASVREREHFGARCNPPNAEPGGGSPSLFEESLSLVEASEVAELACERPLAVAAGMAHRRCRSISSAMYGMRAPDRLRSSRQPSPRRRPGRVRRHLAQVARPRLGERPRLVEAAEHREQHRPRAVLGTGGRQ